MRPNLGLHEGRPAVLRRAMTSHPSDEALPDSGIARLLKAPALRRAQAYAPIPSGAPDPRWILQMSESPEAADLSPGDIVILEGSRLPQSAWQAESLALNLRKAGCAACICVRSKPPKAFQAAYERERVALLGLGADCSPSRVARDVALALMNGADRDSGLEAEGPGRESALLVQRGDGPERPQGR